MTQFRVGFRCDRCGKHWATKRLNEVGDEDVCDECLEDDEEDGDDPITRGRRQEMDQTRPHDPSGGYVGRRRDPEAKAEHFHREGERLEARRQREAMAYALQHGTHYPNSRGSDNSRCARNDT